MSNSPRADHTKPSGYNALTLIVGNTTDMSPRRIRLISCGSISVLGLILLSPSVMQLLFGDGTLISTLAALVGMTLSMGLTTAGVWLYRSENFTTRQASRVATWNLFGVLLISFVVSLIIMHENALDGEHINPVFATGLLTSAAAVTNTLIAIHDVNRIRANALDRERQKLAVLNRILRHNLRNKANIIDGYTREIQSETENPLIEKYTEKVAANVQSIESFGESANTIQDLIESKTNASEHTESLTEITEQIVDPIEYKNPDIDIEITGERVLVNSSAYLPEAVRHVVENAIEHNTSREPRVEVSVRQTPEHGELHVIDNGPGIPASEVAVVSGETKITTTEHGSGFGLWSTKWIVDSLNGSISFEEVENGTHVVISIPRSQ